MKKLISDAIPMPEWAKKIQKFFDKHKIGSRNIVLGENNHTNVSKSDILKNLQQESKKDFKVKLKLEQIKGFEDQLKPEQIKEIKGLIKQGQIKGFEDQLKKRILPKSGSFDRIAKTLLDGKNACFLPITNKILINEEKMAAASFHEMGHALNANTKGLGKVLSKLRKPGIIMALTTMLVAAFKRKKVEGEEPNGIFDKATTFIKNNAGKLAFLGMFPILAEEGLASLKGAKMAKPLLSANAFKKLNKMNFTAWLSYAAATGLVVGSTKIVSWIQDIINAPKRVA